MSGAHWKRGVASAIAVAVLVVALNVRDLAAWLGCPIPRFPIPFGGAAMNVFATSDNAVGSWLAVSVRLFSAALAIGLLWLRWRRRGLVSGPNAIPVPIE